MQLSEKSRAVIGVTMACVVFFIGGIYLGYSDRPTIDSIIGVENKESSATSTDFEPFWKAWSVLNEKSVKADETSDQDKVWGAIKGLTAAYGDHYTEFFDPKETIAFDEAISGEFSGVGLEIGLKNDILTVIAPIKGSPAANAGIKSGDMILEINNESTVGFSVDEAVKKIRGIAGTQVTLSILTKDDKSLDDAKDFAITRATIVVPSLETKTEGDYFIISMATFTGTNINGDIENAMREFKSSGKKNLIIDVRGNPGGYLDSAIYMSSFLLPAGQTVVSEDFNGKQDSIVHTSQGFPVIDNKNTKVAVLVDGGSASASEILAGALHDNDRAIVVGEKTFGKGSVQEIVQITDDTLLKITIAKWLTPKGLSIQDNGITPEHIVELPKDWKPGDKDPVMEKAKSLLK
ncbi:MAG: S41 family peptidase [Candidatus Pacebacteria bacterium]|nr:S41 family peptidase [Candidatus Paceibacterota bacterium]MBP9851940.1 S41 family peptidase [Candidatus Paceibacterota bacterium]